MLYLNPMATVALVMAFIAIAISFITVAFNSVHDWPDGNWLSVWLVLVGIFCLLLVGLVR